MTRKLIFLTHAEVAIDPEVPVPDWPLSEKGHARHAAFVETDVLDNVTALYASAERKARDGADHVAKAKGLSVQIVPPLGENDRSATGFLPPNAFEEAADLFFAAPDSSMRGWETARAAQARVVAATQTITALDQSAGDILIVAHGAVGALLRCHLKGIEITRAEDQRPGGGCYFITDTDLQSPPTDWTRI
ncbi:MAG: histidine phosphatase family protein [Pseudomonadota bacterium]